MDDVVAQFVLDAPPIATASTASLAPTAPLVCGAVGAGDHERDAR